jgi:hypothetical protein
VIDENQLAQAAAAAASRELVTQFGKGIGRLFGPAADEFALMLADGMRHYRLKNAVAILQMAEPLAERKEPGFSASPRVVATVLDQGSWTDSEMLQRYWANLLVNSMTENGRDEESLLYAPILSRLTVVQARFLNALYEFSSTGRSFDAKMRQWFERSGAKNVTEFGASLDALAASHIIKYNGEANYVTPLDDALPLGFDNFGAVFYARINGRALEIGTALAQSPNLAR